MGSMSAMSSIERVMRKHGKRLARDAAPGVDKKTLRPGTRLTYLGTKLEGQFALVRLKDGDGRNWLLIKERDEIMENDVRLIQLGRRHGIPSVALRYSIVQGPRQSFTNAYSGACRVFCLALHLGRRPPIYEDGRQVRDFVNIHDVVDANLRVLEDPRADYRIFNVGGARPYSVLEFAATVARAFGREVELRPSGSYRFGDTRHIVSDVTQLRGLGWEPRRTAEDSVAEYRDWLRGFADVGDVIGRAETRMRELGVVREVAG